MTTPYITPEVFRNFPHGLDLSSVPFPDATPDQQEAELNNVCRRATSEAVRICHQELRATVDTDSEPAPGWRVALNSQGVAEFRLRRFPILRIISGAVALARQFPRQFNQIPATQIALKNSIPGEYGTVVPDAAAVGPDTALFVPGTITWRTGREGYILQVTYLNGWPHAGVTEDVFAYDQTLTVDDTTGWLGVTGTLYDGANTEEAQVIATSTAAGPGILTLAGPLLFDHTIPANPLLFTSMPSVVQTAVCFLAIEQLLVRGATAVTIPTLPGAETHTGRDSGDLRDTAKDLLDAYAVKTW